MRPKPLLSFFKVLLPCFSLSLCIIPDGYSQNSFEKDTIQTTKGNLIMTFIGHGTLLFELNNYVIHIDPVSSEANYAEMPKADLILVTHHHGDHLDLSAIKNIVKENTEIVLTEVCVNNSEDIPGKTTVLENGENTTISDLNIEAIPAYNIKHMRSNGKPFHPKGEGNGYIISFGDKKVYIAGDTENIPEMKALKNIDIAFLPMNLPYTMTPEMVADAAKAFKPKIVYPYHFGNTNTNELVEILKDEKDIEIRVRDLK